uniref:FGFR1 oncogene partner (FOP) N-terminal dimerisation domain-containing protein n=1 Tax=Plectus sambesii TaxID=2011161 RepID=A0A914VS89_9BILA
MADDEPELKEALMLSLEQNGSLARLKAQLRAAIFLALEEKQPKHNPFVSQKAQRFLDTEDGKLTAALVRDFLEAMDMSATMSVFDKEIDVSRTSLPSRSKLAEQHALPLSDTGPLLAQLLKQHHSYKTSAHNFASDLIEKKVDADTHIANHSVHSAAKGQSEENDDDFALETKQPSRPVLSSSNSLEKSLELNDSPRKTALPALTAPVAGTQKKSLLGDLPPTLGLIKPKSSLPPLEALTSIKRPTDDNAATQNQRDFSKLFTDSDAKGPNSPTSSSESQSTSSSTSNSSSSTETKASKKSPKRGSITFTDQAESKANIDQSTLFKSSAKPLANEAIFKKPSPRDMGEIESLSEEIIEDLDVDDLLNSARSNADSISF